MRQINSEICLQNAGCINERQIFKSAVKFKMENVRMVFRCSSSSVFGRSFHIPPEVHLNAREMDLILGCKV